MSYSTDFTSSPPYITPLADPDDGPLLRYLTEQLKRANQAESDANVALQEHQAKVDACTREREAIERAIKAYQHQESPNMRADR